MDEANDQARLSALTYFREGDRGPSGAFGPQWEEELGKDPALKRAVMTVELVFGGDTVVRLATEDLMATSSSTGRQYIYQPQLMEEPDIEWSYTINSGSAEVRTVSFTLQSQLVKPSEIVARGRFLAGFGEISLQLPDGDYDQRIVLIRGEMTGGVSFGEDLEEIEVEISDPKLTANLLVPPWVADTERHSTLPDQWSGERYPLVFNSYTGIEAIRVTPSTSAPEWLGAYGYGLTVDKVFVNGEDTPSGSASTPWGASDNQDGLGTRYTAVEFTAGAYTWEDNDSVHLDVTADVQRDILGIIRELVEGFSVLGVQGSNATLYSRGQGKLPRLVPQVAITASSESAEAGILSFIEGSLSDSFPMISMVYQGGKYGPVVTDYRQDLITADLVTGQYPLVDRPSLVTEIAKEGVFNYFTLKYGWDGMQNIYTGVVNRHPGNDPTCAASRDAVGARTYPTIESPFITTAAQANYVIDWLVAHLAVPSYRVVEDAFPAVLLRMLRGDNVWYTNNGLRWEAERAVVTGIVYRRGQCEVSLRVYPGQRRLHTLRDG